MRSRGIVMMGAIALLGCDTARTVGPANPDRDLLASSDEGFVTTGGAEIIIMVDELTQRWSFNAKRSQSGVFSGQFEFKSDLFGDQLKAQGEVLCFAIDGNRARIGGIVRNSNYLEPGTEIAWNVEDNGEGNNSPPDRASILSAGGVGFATAVCGNPAAYLTTSPVRTGNVQVHD